MTQFGLFPGPPKGPKIMDPIDYLYYFGILGYCFGLFWRARLELQGLTDGWSGGTVPQAFGAGHDGQLERP